MSITQSSLATINNEMTPEQLDLIKSTIAKGASSDELKLFLYRCKHMGFDPLKPGHIHFIKYGNNPGTIVIGIDGFRSKAAQSGKHSGTKRGVLRDDQGNCTGAWCEVYRSDWQHPARVEVALSEYSTGKAQWAKMPTSMIQKVAEVAALRMAFPDTLGGIYSDDEMAQAPEPKQVINHAPQSMVQHQGALKSQALREAMHGPQSTPIEPAPDAEPFNEFDHTDNPSDVMIKVGKKFKGKIFDEVEPAEIKSYCNWLERESEKSGKPLSPAMQEFFEDAYRYLAQKGVV